MVFDKIKNYVGTKLNKKAIQSPNKGNPLPEHKLDEGRLIGQAAKREPDTIKQWKAMLAGMGLKTTDRLLEVAKRDLSMGIGVQPQQPVVQQAPRPMPAPPQSPEQKIGIMQLMDEMIKSKMESSKQIAQLCQERIAESQALSQKFRLPLTPQPPTPPK